MKGSSITIRPDLIIVTSNYSIEECFPAYEDMLAIKRRFKEVDAEEANKILGGRNQYVASRRGLDPNSSD